MTHENVQIGNSLYCDCLIGIIKMPLLKNKSVKDFTQRLLKLTSLL